MSKNKTSTKHRFLRSFLLDKASKHVDNKQKYIAKAGTAKGDELFKYLLLLTCIECEGYVTEIQIQAHRSFSYSIAAAFGGLVLVAGSVGVALYAHLSPGTPSLEIIYISGIAGVISQLISALFFWLYKVSLERMDESHEQLRDVQMISASLFLSGLINDNDQSDVKKQLITQLMSQPMSRYENHVSDEGKKASSPTKDHLNGTLFQEIPTIVPASS